PGGLSAAAGLQVGDIVLSVDHHPIFGVPGCTAALYLHPLDQPVVMEIIRGNQSMTLAIPVLEHHEQLDQLSDLPNLQDNLVPELGVFAIDLDKQVQALLSGVRSDSGVVVVAQAVNSSSLHSGLRPADIIRSINKAPIQSLDQLRSILKAMKPGEPIVLQIE